MIRNTEYLAQVAAELAVKSARMMQHNDCWTVAAVARNDLKSMDRLDVSQLGTAARKLNASQAEEKQRRIWALTQLAA